MRTLTVIGRRWHDGTNTYHTAEIVVDGVSVHRTPFAYGYGNQYETSAAEWLVAHEHLPTGEGHRALWSRCNDLGVEFHSEAHDVKRKKDL